MRELPRLRAVSDCARETSGYGSRTRPCAWAPTGSVSASRLPEASRRRISAWLQISLFKTITNPDSKDKAHALA